MAGAIELGYDPNDILKQCDLPVVLLNTPGMTLNFDEFNRLIRYLMDELKDESIGLLPRPTSRGTYELLVTALVHCESMGEALSEMARLTNRKGDGLAHFADIAPAYGRYRMKSQVAACQYKPLLIESYLISRYRLLCWLTKVRIPLKTIYLSHPPQAWSDQLPYIYPNVLTLHCQPFAGFEFDSIYLSNPIAQQRDKIPETLSLAFAVLPPQDDQLGSLSIQVRDLLHHALRKDKEVLTVSALGERLQLKPHTLRRRLATEGNSYKYLLSLARKDLAGMLLRQDRLSIEEIADRLGYLEVSSFIRAYKNWTGLTPYNFRKQLLPGC